MTKITKTEKFEMIIAELTKADLTEDTTMLVDFCKTEIDAIKTKAEKAKERRAAKAKEDDALLAQVEDVLASSDADYMTIPQIISALGDAELTSGKVTPRLTVLINDGKVTKATVTDNKRKVQGYTYVK